MSDKYNTNTGFSYINNLSIDSNTFRKWDNPPNNNPIISAAKTIDSVHDELGKEAKKAKPTDWEDKAIEYTTVSAITPPLLIKDTLNTYGKCIVTENANSTDEGKVPYVIPNNNEHCYIKDCFPGSCVPGLNNLLDQSIASLKTFFEQTNSSGLLKNPLDGNGGLGQQLFKKNNGDNRLQYTAYFNYDLLIFKYILENYFQQKKTSGKKTTGSKMIDDILNKIINKPQSEYTNKEIQLINTVNLNYLWCYLMIFCKESVEQDPYLTNNNTRNEYYNMLSRFTQIRFDGFMINNDGFISNPLFYYRGTNAYYILDKSSALFVDAVCEKIYNNMKGGNIFQVTILQNKMMAGGIQYTTSQSMAATCISSIMGKLKSVICRNADNKDPIKNACMSELNRLMSNKKQSPSGWSILKFSGDSSHIVYGEIIEWVKNYYQMNFQITYLLSERPLAGRLLAAGKNIIMVSTNIFMKHFSGNGSENKDKRRAALYITFDKSISYINIIEGIFQKITNILNNQTNYTYAYPLIQNITFQQQVTNAPFPQMVSFLQPLLGNNIESNPSSSNIDDAKITALSNIIKSKNIKNILQAYDVDEIVKILQEIPSDFTDIATNLIGRRLGNIRIGSKSNWNFLIGELFKRELDAGYSNPIIIQFDNLTKLLSLNSLLSNSIPNFAGLDSIINNLFKNLLQNQGFNAIYSKMVKSYNKKDDKYNRFEEERIADWLNSKKGEGDKIPNGIMLIIQEILGFIDNCLIVNNVLTNAKVMLGGADKKRKHDDTSDDTNYDTNDDTNYDTNYDTSDELDREEINNMDVVSDDNGTTINNMDVVSDNNGTTIKKQKTYATFTPDSIDELSTNLTQEFIYTLKTIPVSFDASKNSLDFTDINEYYDEIMTEITEIENYVPDFTNSIVTLFNNAIYDTIIDQLIKLSGVTYGHNEKEKTITDINNIIHFYSLSYKNKSNQNFALNGNRLLDILYEFINNDTAKNIGMIQNIRFSNLLENLQNPTLILTNKTKFINAVYKEFPFLFTDMSIELTTINKYQHLINKLMEIATVNSVQTPNNENITDNIFEIILYRQNYNLVLSRYQLLLQQYNIQKQQQEGARTSERISALSRIKSLATTFLGGMPGDGKKTRKNQKSKMTKSKRKTRKRSTNM